MKTTREILIDAICESLGILPGGIADNQTLTDLGADSLDMVEITMLVELALNTTRQLDGAFDADSNPTVAQIVVAIDAMMAVA